MTQTQSHLSGWNFEITLWVGVCQRPGPECILWVGVMRRPRDSVSVSDLDTIASCVLEFLDDRVIGYLSVTQTQSHLVCWSFQKIPWVNICQ